MIIDLIYSQCVTPIQLIILGKWLKVKSYLEIFSHAELLRWQDKVCFYKVKDCVDKILHNLVWLEF